MKRTENEERTKKIEIKERVIDRNKFGWSVFSVSISVGIALGCYQSLEEHDPFKNWLELEHDPFKSWLELKQRLMFSFRSVRKELNHVRFLANKPKIMEDRRDPKRRSE